MYMLSTVISHTGECDAQHATDPCFLNQWGYSAILLVIIGLVLLYLLFKKRKFLVDNLKWIAAVVFLSGFMIYGYAFDEDGSASNSVALAFRAALSSMEMFASHSDLLEVPKHLHESPFYMTIFSVIHFLAVIVSAVFIIKLLGFRFISWLRLLAANFSRKKDCRLFVFWGVNDNAILLANSIQKKATELKKENGEGWENCKFVFVRLLSANESSSHGRFTFSHFFNSSYDGTEKFIEKIEELDGILVNSKFGITGRVIDEVKSEFDLYKYLGLKRVGKLIKKYPQATFYFLSPNEELNLEAVSVFKEIAKYKENRVHDQVQIYCHARKNNQNQKLEICDGLKHQIHIIDSSNLAVLQLKKNVKNHPVNFLNVDTSKACVKKPFTSMIIGFGETGRDAFRFLYEFGALVDEDGNKNPRKIYVVDEHLDELKGDFLMKAPALKEKKNELEWCEGMSIHSDSFWEKLSEIIHDLNYVVIAIGNDNEGMALAIDLYEYAYRYRKDCFNDFRIYLRVNGSCNTIQLKQIKEYFNVYGDTRDVIMTFGAQEDVFSYDVVSMDVREVLAKEFYYAYQKIMIDAMPETNEGEIEKKKKVKENLKQTAEKEWNARREALQKKHNLDAQIRLAYQEEQDRANVWHISTKRFLAGAIEKDGKDNVERLKEMIDMTKRDTNTLNYSNVRDLDSETLFDNLSKCEHLRWNACMELQGFVTGDGDKDFRKKKHKCLVDNEVLRSKYPETVPYDQCVVELSFRLKID